MKHLLQEIVIEAEPALIFDEILKWSESKWWPDIGMKFKRISMEDRDEVVYLQKAAFPLGPKWHTKVVSVDRNNFSIKRSFLDGMFKGGFEQIQLTCLDNKVNLVYDFCYQIHSLINKIAWNAVFIRLHRDNVNKVLSSLKHYVEANLPCLSQ